MTASTFDTELARYGPMRRSTEPPSLDEARDYCRRFARDHYENFSVTSCLLPSHWRQHFCNVYAYCRWADDLADEVDRPKQSLDLLNWWRRQLDDCYLGRMEHPVFVALAETIHRFGIPQQPFADLLQAFVQDQRQQRYATFDELQQYCRCSANPVGRIILHLAASHHEPCIELSDSICTGLQLANFCQDVARDYAAGRIYLPQESWRRCGYGEAEFAARTVDDAWRRLLRHEVDRAESFLLAGWPLVKQVPRDFRFQVSLFVRGGLAILREIRRARYDVWTSRPTVSKRSKLNLLLRAWFLG